MPDLSPDLATVIEAALDVHQAGIYTAMVARVESYDNSNQTVSVQPLIHNTHIGEDDSLVIERHPVLSHVPVVFPGSGGYRITFPVKSGDTVLIVCSTHSLTEWKNTNTESSPADTRRNHPEGAIAIPGLRSPASALSSAPTGFMTVGNDAGPVIEIDGSEIRIGGSLGSEPTLKATTFLTALNTLLGALGAVAAGWATDSSVSAPFVATSTAMAALLGAITTFGTAETAATTLIAKVK